MWQPFDSAFAVGAFDDVPPSNIVFLVLMSVALYAIWTVMCLGFSVPWLKKQDTVALAYTIPAKTTSIGVPLAEAIFIGVTPKLSSKFQIAIVIYQGLQVACGSLLVGLYRRWLESDEKQAKQAQEDQAP